jgi:hypothetical protein
MSGLPTSTVRKCLDVGMASMPLMVENCSKKVVP